MSVLIDMEMPTSCSDCKFFAWKRGVGQHCAVDDRITFHATLDGFDVGYERNGNCPLVPVPPHGDLIDRHEAYLRFGKLAETLEERNGYEAGAPYAMAAMFLNNANEFPTVIPASKEG